MKKIKQTVTEFERLYPPNDTGLNKKERRKKNSNRYAYNTKFSLYSCGCNKKKKKLK